MQIHLADSVNLIQWLRAGAVSSPAEAGLSEEFGYLFKRSGNNIPTREELGRLVAGQMLTYQSKPYYHLDPRVGRLVRDQTRILPISQERVGVLSGVVLVASLAVLLEEPLTLLPPDPWKASLEVYRAPEIQELESAILACLDRRPSWIVVAGPSGTGKSTVIRHVIEKSAHAPELMMHVDGLVSEDVDPGKVHVVDLPVLRESEIAEALAIRHIDPDRLIFVPCKPLTYSQQNLLEAGGREFYRFMIAREPFALGRDPAAGRRQPLQISPSDDPLMRALLTEKFRYASPDGPPFGEEGAYAQAVAWCHRLTNVLESQETLSLAPGIFKTLACSRDWIAEDGFQNVQNAVDALRISILLFLICKESSYQSGPECFNGFKLFLSRLCPKGSSGPIEDAQQRYEFLFRRGDEFEIYRRGRLLGNEGLVSRLIFHMAEEARHRNLSPVEQRLLEFSLKEPASS